MLVRSINRAGLLGAAAALLSAAPAAAATLAPITDCYRYAPTLAGQEWVGLTGSGFTPGTDPSFNGVRLAYSNGDLGGHAPLAADGSFADGFFMPSEFIRSDSGRVKKYTITATDLANPALTATTEVTFVRAGVITKPSSVRRNLGRRVRWSAYGAPSGAKLFVHWTFKGRRRATRSMGRAKGPCGIARKKLPFLPVTPRNGTWKVFITRGRKLKRKRALFRVDLSVFTTFR